MPTYSLTQAEMAAIMAEAERRQAFANTVPTTPSQRALELAMAEREVALRVGDTRDAAFREQMMAEARERVRAEMQQMFQPAPANYTFGFTGFRTAAYSTAEAQQNLAPPRSTPPPAPKLEIAHTHKRKITLEE